MSCLAPGALRVLGCAGEGAVCPLWTRPSQLEGRRGLTKATFSSLENFSISSNPWMLIPSSGRSFFFFFFKWVSRILWTMKAAFKRGHFGCVFREYWTSQTRRGQARNHWRGIVRLCLFTTTPVILNELIRMKTASDELWFKKNSYRMGEGAALKQFFPTFLHVLSSKFLRALPLWLRFGQPDHKIVTKITMLFGQIFN